MFKQFLQAGAMDVCQIDACRLGGVNEVVAVLLLAARFGVPVCPHAGGVGLCELVQHLAIFDYLCVSGSLDGRMIEYVDHLHEHFLDPVVVSSGRYRVPTRPGYSGEMARASLDRYRFPGGAAWTEIEPDGREPAALVSRFGTERIAGPIFASRTALAAGGEVEMPVFDKGFAAAEAEFLLRIGRKPDPAQTRFTLEEAADMIDAVHVGIEIASSPLRAINELGPVAIVSDFGNNNGLVVGPAIADGRTSGFETWPVSTFIDGVEVGTGQATGFPNGAIGAARFLFELMARRGIALEPGQWISSGAVSGVHDARPGQSIEARFADKMQVRCRLVAAAPFPVEKRVGELLEPGARRASSDGQRTS
jgi:2-keto-4-pentenoate hydratase